MQTFTISFTYQGSLYYAECVARIRSRGVEYFIVPANQELLANFGPSVIWKEPDDIHRLRESSVDPEYNIAVTGGLFKYFCSVA